MVVDKALLVLAWYSSLYHVIETDDDVTVTVMVNHRYL